VRKFILDISVMAETRYESSNYRNIIEISERITRPEVRKDAKDRTPDAHISRKQGSYNKAPAGRYFCVKDAKVSNSVKKIDVKDVKCFRCHKKGHYANKALPLCKSEGWKRLFQGEEARRARRKMINQANQNQSFNLNHSDPGPFS